MYLSQPLNLSYFPPNREQFLNMRRPSMAPAPQHPNTQQPSRTTSASEDEEESTYMAQDIRWQTVKGMKRKKNTGLLKIPRPQTYQSTIVSMPQWTLEMTMQTQAPRF